MSNGLQITHGEIPDITPGKREMKLRCTGKGEALHARWTFLFPIVITSRALVGKLGDETLQNVEIMGVRCGGEMHKAIPSYVEAGNLDIIVQSPGAETISIVMSCRIEAHAGDETGSVDAVADAVAALEESSFGEADASDEASAADGKSQPKRRMDWGVNARRIGLESVEVPEQLGSDGPMPVVTPEMAEQATADLEGLLASREMDPATKASVEAFLAADGDPTGALKE